MADETTPISDIEQKLTDLTEEELIVMENLFTIEQDIEQMEREENNIKHQMEDIRKDISAIEDNIAAEQSNYNIKRDSLGQILQSYQRRGAGTFIEMVLGSESVSDLLDRLNLLRDLARNTGQLLDEMDESLRILALEKEKLNDSLERLGSKQQELNDAIAAKTQLKHEQENYLASLNEQKQFYQEQLSNLRTVWSNLKQLFPKVTDEFSKLLVESSLPPDTIKISFSFFSIKGTLEDTVLNKIIKDYSRLPEMIFTFNQDEIIISIPEMYMTLSGSLKVSDSSVLVFQPEKGSFYGLPLKNESMDELFRDGPLVLDLNPVIGKGRVDSVAIRKGYLELTILPLLQ